MDRVVLEQEILRLLKTRSMSRSELYEALAKQVSDGTADKGICDLSSPNQLTPVLSRMKGKCLITRNCKASTKNSVWSIVITNTFI